MSRFADDSPVEGGGFEPSVPLWRTVPGRNARIPRRINPHTEVTIIVQEGKLDAILGLLSRGKFYGARHIEFRGGRDDHARDDVQIVALSLAGLRDIFR
jgi:hypothetical protein